MGNSALDDYKLGKSKNTPNANVLNELFKDAKLGDSGICTFNFGNDTQLSFPSNVCSGIIDVKSFKCDPKQDDDCPL